MVVQRVNESLDRALPTDPTGATMPVRYDIVSPDGSRIGENVELMLKNPITTAGTPQNELAWNECLAASGVTGGTYPNLTLAQPGFYISDGFAIRFRLHVAIAQSTAVNLNVGGTGGKALLTVDGLPLTNVGVNNYLTAIYSQPKDAWVVQGGTAANPNLAFGITGGTFPSFTLASPGFILADGAIASFRLHSAIPSTNTNNVSLNVNNTGVKLLDTIWRNGIRDIPVDMSCLAVYSAGLDRWVLISPLNDSIARVGRYALNNLTTGTNNAAFGQSALAAVTSGSRNIGIGNNAGLSITTGNDNIGVGYNAFFSAGTSAHSNIGIGSEALSNVTMTAYDNIGMGQQAIRYCAGHGNVAMNGLNKITSGNNNVGIGPGAGDSITTGNENIVIGIGGATALAQNVSHNVVIGSNSDVYNIFEEPVTMTYCIGLGPIGGFSGASNFQNQTVIGAEAYGEGNNSVRIGNSNITRIAGQVGWTNASDSRIKEDIQEADIDLCLQNVINLPIKYFKYKPYTGQHLDQHTLGFLADDVEQIFPHVVQSQDKQYPFLDKNGNPKTKKVWRTIKEQTGIDDKGKPMYEDIQEEVTVADTFLMEGVKDITWGAGGAGDLHVTVLWGAVQALTKKVEYLEGLLSKK